MIVIEQTNKPPAVLKPLDIAKLEKELAYILRTKSKKVASLTFVTEAKIQKLNHDFRKINKPTDVLSFQVGPALHGIGEEGKSLLGDIVVCTAYARHEADRRGMTLREELIRLIAHGVLHLSGYDHATTEEEAKMFAMQERVVEAVLSV